MLINIDLFGADHIPTVHHVINWIKHGAKTPSNLLFLFASLTQKNIELGDQ